MAITTMDGLVSGLANGEVLPIIKATVANQAAGGWTSLWRATGVPIAGTIPTGSTTCTASIDGSWAWPSQFTTTSSTYLTNISISGGTSHQLYVFDRLYHIGGLSGSLNTTQTASVVIPASRDASVGSSGLLWFFEIFTDIGTTTVTATINFTNQADAATTTTMYLAGASPLNRAGRLFQIVPPAGNQIKAINHILLSATTGVAGNFGIVCGRLLTSVPFGPVNTGMAYDFASLGLPKIPTNAHLWLVLLSSATASGALQGNLTIAQG